ncbi:TIGR00266 family protein [bacterium CPR1]|nr:TIGR00266 family protein [bacterium CPR1]
MKYAINGTLLQTLTLELTPGDRLYSQTHSMSWMSDGVRVSTHTGGGLWEGVKRAFSGSSLFLTEFEVDLPARVAFAARYPGTIVPLDLKTGESILCRRESFLCAQKSVSLELAFHNPDVWLFGSQGLAMQKVTGPGLAFIDLSGELVEQTLADGERLHLRPGHVGMYEPTVRFEVNMVEGVSNALFGQGLFMATLTGPGRIWLQTMPLEHLVDALGLRRGQTSVTVSRSRREREKEPARPAPPPEPTPRPSRGMVSKLFDFLFDDGPVLGPGPPSRKLDTVRDRTDEVRDRAPRSKSGSGFSFGPASGSKDDSSSSSRPGIGFSWGGGASSDSPSSRDEDNDRRGGYGLNF